MYKGSLVGMGQGMPVNMDSNFYTPIKKNGGYM